MASRLLGGRESKRWFPTANKQNNQTNDMDIYVVTSKQMDIYCPIVVFMSLTPEGARHYVDEALGIQLKYNEYRGEAKYHYEMETVHDAKYGNNYHLPDMESKALFHAYNQHDEGYSIFAVKVKQ